MKENSPEDNRSKGLEQVIDYNNELKKISLDLVSTDGDTIIKAMKRYLSVLEGLSKENFVESIKSEFSNFALRNSEDTEQIYKVKLGNNIIEGIQQMADLFTPILERMQDKLTEVESQNTIAQAANSVQNLDNIIPGDIRIDAKQNADYMSRGLELIQELLNK